jgi:hypothetical protein
MDFAQGGNLGAKNLSACESQAADHPSQAAGQFLSETTGEHFPKVTNSFAASALSARPRNARWHG